MSNAFKMFILFVLIAGQAQALVNVAEGRFKSIAENQLPLQRISAPVETLTTDQIAASKGYAGKVKQIVDTALKEVQEFVQDEMLRGAQGRCGYNGQQKCRLQEEEVSKARLEIMQKSWRVISQIPKSKVAMGNFKSAAQIFSQELNGLAELMQKENVGLSKLIGQFNADSFCLSVNLRLSKILLSTAEQELNFDKDKDAQTQVSYQKIIATGAISLLNILEENVHILRAVPGLQLLLQNNLSFAAFNVLKRASSNLQTQTIERLVRIVQFTHEAAGDLQRRGDQLQAFYLLESVIQFAQGQINLVKNVIAMSN